MPKKNKDPAVLWYPDNWIGGTSLFTREEKGAYMDLLMAQFHNTYMTIMKQVDDPHMNTQVDQFKVTHMSPRDIQHVLGNDYERLWNDRIKSKFEVDKDGNYFNLRLEKEILKRIGFCISRLNNSPFKKRQVGGPHMIPHMGTENGPLPEVEYEYDYNEEFIKFVNLWNSLPEPFPKITMLGNREAKLRKRITDPWWVKNYVTAIEKMKASSFCKGQNDRGWIADLEFFLRPDTVAKLIEGKYDDRKGGSNGKSKYDGVGRTVDVDKAGDPGNIPES